MTTLLGQGFITFGAVVYLLEGWGVIVGAAGNHHPRFVLLLLVFGAACASVSYFAQLWCHAHPKFRGPAAWCAIMALIAISWIVPLVVAALIALNGGYRGTVAVLLPLPDAAPIAEGPRFVPASNSLPPRGGCVSPDHSTAWTC